MLMDLGLWKDGFNAKDGLGYYRIYEESQWKVCIGFGWKEGA